MTRDLTEQQLRDALARNGLIVDSVNAIRCPGGPNPKGAYLCTLHSPRRQCLAVAIERAERLRATRARRAAIKEAWDAEFAQPIEPRFVAEIAGLCLRFNEMAIEHADRADAQGG